MPIGQPQPPTNRSGGSGLKYRTVSDSADNAGVQFQNVSIYQLLMERQARFTGSYPFKTFDAVRVLGRQLWSIPTMRRAESPLDQGFQPVEYAAAPELFEKPLLSRCARELACCLSMGLPVRDRYRTGRGDINRLS